MKDAIWQIDYEKQEITITDQIDRLKIDSTLKPLDFEQNSTGSPVLDILVANKKSTIILDTGSPYAISLSTKEFSTLKKDNIPTINYVTTLFGQTIDTVYQTPNTTIMLNDQQTFTNTAIKLRSALSESLLGNEFMKNYRITIDWTYRQLYFECYEKEN
jgi:hypothetical protein